MKQLFTPWTEQAGPEHALPEYPRPMMIRDNYTNLNGLWDYAFTSTEEPPKVYDGRILVPFSPESYLSGVQRQLQPSEFLWYRRDLCVADWDARRDDHRLLLHFGAVDQTCTVYVNGREAVSHVGGYLPFSADISDLLKDGSNELVVKVRDLSDTSYHAVGKQKLKRGGMYYTATSGIWQTVWMEEVHKDYIEEVIAAPDADAGTVRFLIRSDADMTVEISVCKPGLYDEDTAPGTEELLSIQGRTNTPVTASLPAPALWTCETPYLYYYTVRMVISQRKII